VRRSSQSFTGIKSRMLRLSDDCRARR
jgi:hypothetical protein